MLEILADIRQRLLNKEYHNEEHIRFSLVARVLQALDWDIWNPGEVYTEFKAAKKEDQTRVDVALFTQDFEGTAIFIECKGVGAFGNDLSSVERQLRDYNRDHTALFTIITDGRHWRFYFSFTSGEFKDKLFCKFDLQQDGLEEAAEYLDTFLRRGNILNQTARRKAEAYLMLGKKERAMQDVLPDAQKLVTLPPFPSLPQAMVQLLAAKVLTITPAEAQAFLMGTQVTAVPMVAEPPTKPALKSKVPLLQKVAPKPKSILPSSGVPPQEQPAKSLQFTLALNRAGVKATADWNPQTQQMQVHAGSTAMREGRDSVTAGSAALRKQLLAQQVLLEQDGRLVFQTSYTFASAAQAAEVICGYSVNARQAWRDAGDKALGEYGNK